MSKNFLSFATENKCRLLGTNFMRQDSLKELLCFRVQTVFDQVSTRKRQQRNGYFSFLLFIKDLAGNNKKWNFRLISDQFEIENILKWERIVNEMQWFQFRVKNVYDVNRPPSLRMVKCNCWWMIFPDIFLAYWHKELRRNETTALQIIAVTQQVL